MEQFENPKAGDKVFVHTNWGKRRLSTIEKITPKGFIKVDGALFTKAGFQRGGGPWHFCNISPASPEEIETYEKEVFVADVVSRLHSISTLDYEKAVLFHKLLNDTE